MEQGSLGELYLTRSVIKHIRKHNKSVATGSGVGKDYSMVKTHSQWTVLSESVAATPYIAWTKAMNNLYVSGGNVAGARVTYLLPKDVQEEQLKEYSASFNSLADDAGIQIIGGHTAVSGAYKKATFVVEALGETSDELKLTGKAKPGYQVVMAGYTAMLGTNLIISNRYEELTDRFATSYVEGGRFKGEPDCYSVEAIVKVAMELKCKAELCYMHDISHGGVYGALWQTGEALNLGIKVNHCAIPIKQETVEFCNYYDINPYMLEGTGALILVARDGESLTEALKKAGISAEVVGVLTDHKERAVELTTAGMGEIPHMMTCGAGKIEKRFLTPVKGDEIYKVISAY